MSIQKEIQRLEKAIRLLKMQYDQYFAGALDRPPFELRADIERIIKRYSSAPMRRFSQRFHFNSLVNRYNTYAELWAKCVRWKEEGRPPPWAPSTSPPGAPRQEAAQAEPEDGSAPGNLVLQHVIEFPDGDSSSLRPLYEKYVEALRTRGGAAPSVTFRNFFRLIRRKAEAVKHRAACDAVRLRLTVDGDRVLLKAQPVIRRKGPS